ncbi:transporter substrate-binding domain-containing protein [Hahella sp. KA22]|uniref:substrate-binding periplasmic protein n=1 Tax=Hahella sp. KA22 TaxID=1628392 RepID=UPI000FDE9D23|nr:transporter substrate-binding domain-containing protein [Hahella sp. KA22]AZZ92887.1 amino acid ABC transporter substrate-binding protein [Hahella sp. KA22]QAY56261.1 transporter substrate-binding domain-containing protein [Hahella sp. KA22]
MFKTILLFLFAWGIAYQSAWAEERAYRFVTLEFPPLEFTGEDGEPTGVAVEVVHRVMAALGLQVSIDVHPWSRSLDRVRKGDADAIFTAYKTPEREQFLDYSNVVLIPQVIALYARKDSPINFNGDLLALQDKQFGVVSTISYGAVFDQMRNQLRVQRVEDIEQNFKKLMLGRIDILISNIYVADWELKKTGFTKHISRLPLEVERLPSFIAFSKARDLTALRDRFDKELLRLKESGEFDAIVAKYDLTVPPDIQ